MLEDIPRDSEGYLKSDQDWNRQIAQELAQEEEITLTDEHWELIEFVQSFYRAYNTTPAMRMLVKAVKEKYGEEKGNSIYLHRLFPKGPAKQISKIGGLPKPVKCI
ncbi:MAG: TusE/DsrC/DsvC family sulfur relay protein [Succinivibrionaceae bacterium]|nr:TusE/DsrC/DsvC family sulfur relay protein [Succinivibrionaceae bacterium]